MYSLQKELAHETRILVPGPQKNAEQPNCCRPGPTSCQCSRTIGTHWYALAGSLSISGNVDQFPHKALNKSPLFPWLNPQSTGSCSPDTGAVSRCTVAKLE
jgi:hypothetical protein